MARVGDRNRFVGIFASKDLAAVAPSDGTSARGIMVNMVLCVIPGQGNSKILNLVKSGSFDSPIFLYIPNDEKTSTGHLI